MRTSFSLLFLVVLLSLSSSSSADHWVSDATVVDSPFLTQKLGTNRTIKVDVDGNGEFRTVQAAIDSVPDGNSQWIIVHIRKGTYREKVHIPKTKPFIFMRGNGKGKTRIIWDHSTDDNNTESATLRVEADHFIAFGVSFKNDANIGLPATLVKEKQSVAALVAGDKVAFYHCAFYSAHNTLFDYKGRHYYCDCYIQGSVDFIFGRARSVYHDCDIFVVSDDRVEIGGSITAQSRESAEEKSGYVFFKGQVYGIGGVYLGRTKGAFSRTIFSQTYLSYTIVPEGWTNWSYKGSTENIFQAEHRCHGPGASSDKRAPWAKQLNDEEVKPYISVDFIEGNDWLPAHKLLDS